MSSLEENLKKVVVVQKYVALCAMNQCARPASTADGGTVPTIIALEDSEGIANQKAEAHRNSHRDHERYVASVLKKAREADSEPVVIKRKKDAPDPEVMMGELLQAAEKDADA